MHRSLAIASAVVACLLSTSNYAQNQPKQLPTQAFTRFNEFASIKLSPSGEYITYLGGKFGRSAIFIVSLKDKKRVGGVQCPEGQEIYQFDWASNTRLIYQLAERQNGEATPTPTGEIMSADITGKSQNWVYGYRIGEQSTGTHLRVKESSYATPELISTLKDDDANVLIAEHPWREGSSSWYYDPDAKPIVSRLNIFDGKKTKVDVAPLADATILVDNKDQVRFAMGENEKQRNRAAWKPNPKGDWVAFDFPEFRNDSIEPYVFDDATQSVLFSGVRTSDHYSALYSLDLKTQNVTKVFGFDNSDVSGVIKDFSGTKVVGVAGYAEKSLVHWLSDDRAAKIFAALYRAFPQMEVSVESTTDDGRLAIVLVSSDVDPGLYYLFDTQTMHADLLRPAREWIDPEQMRHKTPFALKARDGLELHGYLTEPAGTGPFPTVVLPHGGPHGVRDYWAYDPEVQLLANRGYAVLQINFRGSGGYSRDFQQAGYEEWGARIQDDITDATRWAIEKKVAAPDRICIYGASFGAYAALMGAVREPKLYRCAIGYAGIYDLELMLSSADIHRSKSGRAYLEMALGDDRAKMRSRSPVYNAQKIEAPVLLIHGTADWRADFEQAKRMKAALTAEHKQFEWSALTGEGHGAYDEKTRLEVYERILKFLDKNLAAGK